MKFNERQRIYVYGDGKTSWGEIPLKHLAKPETVKITYAGREIIPEKFNIYGEPILSIETSMLLKFEEERIRRNPGTKDFTLEVDVTYEEQDFWVPLKEFNTVEGIKKYLKDLKSFNQMLNWRSLWRKATDKQPYLHQFIVFGKYELDPFGQVLTITAAEYANAVIIPNVCTADYFINTVVKSYSTSSISYIPDSGSKCPCCGKEFTIDDLKNSILNEINDNICHDSCRRNYLHYKEISDFTTHLMDLIYRDEPAYELLPNGCCNRDCCTHIPWFLFHTSDGDIKIGCWRNHVISIEWQENFKPFDMAIFNNEDVTKWCDERYIAKAIEPGTTPTNGIRGIHAHGRDKASEYLKKVKESVNPET